MLFQLSYLVKFYLFFFIIPISLIFFNLPLTRFSIHWLMWRIMIFIFFPTTIFITMLSKKTYIKFISNSLKNFIIWFAPRGIKINTTIILLSITSIPFYSPVTRVPSIPIKPRSIFKSLRMTFFIH